MGTIANQIALAARLIDLGVEAEEILAPRRISSHALPVGRTGNAMNTTQKPRPIKRETL